MSRRPLWTISVLTTAEGEDAVSNVLTRVVSQPASSYTDLETGATRVTVYLERRPKRFPVLSESLRTELQRLGTCGLDVRPAKISLNRVQPQDWAESWKRHFKPIELGAALLIRPSWSQRKPRRGQELLVLDPGLSFGTGHHPTTLFCLQQIVSFRRISSHPSCLDLGTGSGILALAAAKLGYRPVEAMDNDPDAVRIARSNGRLNRLPRAIQFRVADLTKLPLRPHRTFDLVCANLIAPLLLAHRNRILARLASAGRLVLAGILRTELPRIRSAYEADGLELVASQSKKEWSSAAFAWRVTA